MNVILFGPPGAGKGTQSNRLQKITNVPHIASGDIFREIRREDTPLAREVRRFMDRGEYVPDQLTIELVLERLTEPDARAGFLLDGFPRTLPQAAALDRALAERGQRVEVALYITAPTALLVRRITGRIVCPQCNAVYNADTKPPSRDMICDVCGHELERRSDEDPNVVTIRLDNYVRQTQPLVEYYRGKGVLAEIDGARPMEEVETAVDKALGLSSVP
jgi:adenylate kinase